MDTTDVEQVYMDVAAQKSAEEDEIIERVLAEARQTLVRLLIANEPSSIMRIKITKKSIHED